MTDDERTELFSDVIKFARTDLADEIDKAYEYFFDEDEPEDFLSGTALALAFINFEDWFACDHSTVDGDPVIDIFIRSCKSLGPEAHATLDAMRDSFISLYEVVQSNGETVLRDLLLDTEFAALGHMLSSLNAGDVFATRFLDLDGKRVMSRSVYPFGHGFKEKVMEYVNIQFDRYRRNKNHGGSMEDFLREENYVFNIIWINSILSQQSKLMRRQGPDA